VEQEQTWTNPSVYFINWERRPRIQSEKSIHKAKEEDVLIRGGIAPSFRSFVLGMGH